MTHDDQAALQEEIRAVAAQQESLQLDHFDNDDAWRLGCLLVELGRSRELPIAVDIQRHGHQLFHASLPGTVADNDTWLRRKSRVVERFGVPSYLAGLRARAKGVPFPEATGLPVQEYAAHGGSFPLTIRGVGIVGTVTVSGLAQEDDHALVIEALENFLAADGAGAGSRP